MITMILVIVLLAGGVALVQLGIQSTRSTALVVDRKAALHCAEAGLISARRAVGDNYGLWTGSLCNPDTGCDVGAPGATPTWLLAADRDLDDDGVDDVVITLVDNDDELAPQANDRALDNDQHVYIVATCTKYPEVRERVSELVQVTPGETCYDAQKGGCTGTGG